MGVTLKKEETYFLKMKIIVVLLSFITFVNAGCRINQDRHIKKILHDEAYEALQHIKENGKDSKSCHDVMIDYLQNEFVFNKWKGLDFVKTHYERKGSWCNRNSNIAHRASNHYYQKLQKLTRNC